MNTILKTFFILILIFTLMPLMGFSFGHGHPCMLSSTDYRIHDESFSKHSVTVGESFEIEGKIQKIMKDSVELKPWAIVTVSDKSYIIDDVVRVFYEDDSKCNKQSTDGNINWYFTITTDPSESLSLEHTDDVNYSITLKPLKAGTYHVHPAMFDGDLYTWGSGETITVEGKDKITEGEIFGFYLPFFSIIVMIIFGITISIIFSKEKPIAETNGF